MKANRQMIKGTIAVLLVSTLVSGCSKTEGAKPPTTVVIREGMNELERDPVPGTVNDVWAEPMYDTVRVPGQLDPRGIYYRKAHQELVEIRPGRYQLVQFPNDRTVSDEYVTDPMGTIPADGSGMAPGGNGERSGGEPGLPTQ